MGSIWLAETLADSARLASGTKLVRSWSWSPQAISGTDIMDEQHDGHNLVSNAHYSKERA